ncbi:Zinc transporter 11 [Acorus calamus]|uniref:Zinc transporter 11 n=1 Tax=Acorus calamus TaxID=4465 RepID=A0AAV9D8G2_ACOCL|nr:Zinc transporter 11 [Acorus calamus]
MVSLITFALGLSPRLLHGRLVMLGGQFAAGLFSQLFVVMINRSADEFDALLSSTTTTKRLFPFFFAYAFAFLGFLLPVAGAGAARLIGRLVKCSGNEMEEEEEEFLELEIGETGKEMKAKIESSLEVTMVIVIIVLALDYASVSRTLDVGVIGTKWNGWWNLLLFCARQFLAATAAGFMAQNTVPSACSHRTSTAFSFLYALSSPVGLAIGIATASGTPRGVAEANWVPAASDAIAGGAFAYAAISLACKRMSYSMGVGFLAIFCGGLMFFIIW